MILSRGFTLMELLVVIAIIGILASVILGSLNDARNGGLEAKIKSELVMISKRASVEESTNFTFDTVCGTNGFPQSPDVVRIIESIERFSPEAVVCNSEGETYAVSAAVASSSYWCIDSTGFSNVVASQLNTAPAEYACP